jgi:hypothetical protein
MDEEAREVVLTTMVAMDWSARVQAEEEALMLEQCRNMYMRGRTWQDVRRIEQAQLGDSEEINRRLTSIKRTYGNNRNGHCSTVCIIYSSLLAISNGEFLLTPAPPAVLNLQILVCRPDSSHPSSSSPPLCLFKKKYSTAHSSLD